MKKRTLVFVMLVATLAGACNTGGDAVGVDVPRSADAASDTGVDAGTWDTLFGDTADDLPFDASDDGGPGDQVAPDLTPDTGGDPTPCLTNEDCESGYCVQGPDGKVCTDTCIEDCPAGWVCKPLAGGPDTVSICVYPYLNLCRPCAGHEDCNGDLWEGDNLCIPTGPGGSFCGVECGPSVACPAGYLCEEVEVVAGITMDQCVPDTLECACTEEYVAAGAWTPCSLTNDLGTCPGERVCAVDGLSPCDAPIPAEETCDGTDEDCDGETDEGTGGGTCEKENEHGVCEGALSCEGGQLVCSAGTPAAEACNGIDDDCDGSADEDFPDADQDGEANCTDQDDDGDGVPDEEDNCPLAANPAQENFDLDGQGDACDADDDNDLVPDETDCGPFDPAIKPGAEEVCDQQDNNCDGEIDEGGVCWSGACAGLGEGDACDDDDPCTEADVCLGGACVGVIKDCSPLTTPCLLGTCQEGACLAVPKEGPCTDGDPCTTGDSCQSGSCVGSPKDCSFLDGACTAGSCTAGTCLQVDLVGAICDDEDPCTQEDICVAGGVCSGVALDCSGLDSPCTFGACLDGVCGAVDLLGPCDDDDPCTTGDACQLGLCVGTPKDCTFLDSPCTEGGCVGGSCQQELVVGPCTDGDPATVEDTCTNGACVGLPDPDLDGIPNEGYEGPCVGNGVDNCNDNCPEDPNPDQTDADGNGVGDACTCVPECDGKGCGADGCGGSCGTCDDDNACTLDICQEGGTCVHPAGNEGQACAGAGLCVGACQAGGCVETAVEVCNGVDDDCDDAIDEAADACPPLQHCEGTSCVDDCSPVNGAWTGWDCGTCSAECGGGQQICTRTCTAPAPSCGGAPCAGDDTLILDCNTQPCCDPVNGGWTGWSCGSCSAECGGGILTCTRSCTNPPPSCGGAGCSGSTVSTESCNTQPCVNYLPTGTTVYSPGEPVVTGLVPAATSSIQLTRWGGGGGGGAPGGGGGGAFVQGTLSVSPGDEIELRVAGGGEKENGGGGATYVYKNGAVVLVAAGGGGGGSDGCSGCHKSGNPSYGQGGGGGPVGGVGQAGTADNTYGCLAGAGQGGSQGAGGAGGTMSDGSGYSGCVVTGLPGSAHTGGKNTTSNCNPGSAASYHLGSNNGGGNGSGGGGGAGYFGGGGGAAKYTYNGGGGGGGASWVAGGVSGLNTQGGSGINPGGTGISGYQGSAGRGGQGQTDPFNGSLQATDGNPGLIIMVL